MHLAVNVADLVQIALKITSEKPIFDGSYYFET